MTSRRETPSPVPLSALDWHVLMALVEQDLHGYAIMKAVRRDSGGAVSAEIGSLYRVLSRLMTNQWVKEVDVKDAPTETRGRARRYYRLTSEGKGALRRESMRLDAAVRLARTRHLFPNPSKR